MIEDSDILLVKPRLDLAEPLRDALIESYQDHITFLLWPEPNPDIESVRQNIQSAIENFDNDRNEYRFLVVRKSDDRLLGTVSLMIINPKIPYMEFGYWVRSSESGKGYIGKAAKLLEDFGVQHLNARRLEIRMAESNIKSKRIAERLGFKFEAKIHSDRVLSNGEVDNSLVYYKLYS